MPLPKSNSPIFPIEIPSTGKKEKFRQWKVREEKILLVAKESDEASDKLRSVYQVVNNCSVEDGGIDQKLTISDLEWTFLKLREITVGNILDLTYVEGEDEYPVQVDLSKVEPPEKLERTKNIVVDKTLSFEIGRPMAELYLDDKLINSGFKVDDVLVRCLKSVSDSERRYDIFSQEEAEEFFDGLDIKSMEEARKFIMESPSMKYDVKYKNKAGVERTVKLRTLLDFFTL